MIVSKNVLNLSEQTTGRFRCTFNYVLDDGREINIKPSNVGADYQAVCDAGAASVFESVIKSDAKEAVTLEIDTPHKYANQNAVLYAFLVEGYEISDPIRSYLKMKKPVAKIQSAGITLQQLANYSGEPLSYFQDMLVKWQTLNANKAMMQEYNALREAL